MQARKDSKAGKKRLIGSQEETKRQGRSGSLRKLQRQAAKERLKGRQPRKDVKAGSKGKTEMYASMESIKDRQGKPQRQARKASQASKVRPTGRREKTQRPARID